MSWLYVSWLAPFQSFSAGQHSSKISCQENSSCQLYVWLFPVPPILFVTDCTLTRTNTLHSKSFFKFLPGKHSFFKQFFHFIGVKLVRNALKPTLANNMYTCIYTLKRRGFSLRCNLLLADAFPLFSVVSILTIFSPSLQFIKPVTTDCEILSSLFFCMLIICAIPDCAICKKGFDGNLFKTERIPQLWLLKSVSPS